MYWRAVVAGVAWGVGYLACCYPRRPRVPAGARGGRRPRGGGPRGGAAAGGLPPGGPAESTRYGLAAGALTGLVFVAAFWHIVSVARFNTVTPLGRGGAFYAAKLTFAYSAGDVSLIARYPGRAAGALALAGGTAIALLGSYAGYAADRRDRTQFIE